MNFRTAKKLCNDMNLGYSTIRNTGGDHVIQFIDGHNRIIKISDACLVIWGYEGRAFEKNYRDYRLEAATGESTHAQVLHGDHLLYALSIDTRDRRGGA